MRELTSPVLEYINKEIYTDIRIYGYMNMWLNSFVRELTSPVRGFTDIRILEYTDELNCDCTHLPSAGIYIYIYKYIKVYKHISTG